MFQGERSNQQVTIARARVTRCQTILYQLFIVLVSIRILQLKTTDYRKFINIWAHLETI